jgi:hypothetical protein
VRNKLIITGAIGVMAAATLTVNAQNGSHQAIQTKATSPVALAHTVSVDRDDVVLAARATAAASTKAETEELAKPAIQVKPAATPAGLSSACQAAIANLKAMHQADIAEDASERSSVSSRTAATIAADRAEDAAELQKWASALTAARSACAPATATACRTAVTGLQAALLAWRTAELAEAPGAETDWATDFAPIRTAFSGLATACADRD